MWISKKKWSDLEKRVDDLEKYRRRCEDAGGSIRDHLRIDTRTGEISLNEEDVGPTREVDIKLHDDDRITVSITLISGEKKIISPCEVDMHLRVGPDGRPGWLLGI